MAAKHGIFLDKCILNKKVIQTTFIEVFDNRENKILDKYDLYELVTYLKIFYEGISFYSLYMLSD